MNYVNVNKRVWNTLQGKKKKKLGQNCNTIHSDEFKHYILIWTNSHNRGMMAIKPSLLVIQNYSCPSLN